MTKVNIDLTYLNNIAGGDGEFIREMLNMFLVSAPAEVDNIEQYFLAGNLVMMGSAAHKIKAPVQMIGADALNELIVKIELIAKHGEGVDEAAAAIASLKDIMKDVTSQVEALIATL